MEGISIIENKDSDEITIKTDLINLTIGVMEFAQLTAIHFSENVSIMELCLSFQEQF